MHELRTPYNIVCADQLIMNGERALAITNILHTHWTVYTSIIFLHS